MTIATLSHAPQSPLMERAHLGFGKNPAVTSITQELRKNQLIEVIVSQEGDIVFTNSPLFLFDSNTLQEELQLTSLKPRDDGRFILVLPESDSIDSALVNNIVTDFNTALNIAARAISNN